MSKKAQFLCLIGSIVLTAYGRGEPFPAELPGHLAESGLVTNKEMDFAQRWFNAVTASQG